MTGVLGFVEMSYTYLLRSFILNTSYRLSEPGTSRPLARSFLINA